MSALLLSLLLTASPSSQLFKQGKAHFEKGQLTEALAAFEKAHALEPSPELLLNIAQCNRGLGRRAEAITALEQFLAQAPKHPLRTAVENTLHDLRLEVAKDTPAKVELTPSPEPVVPVVMPPPPVELPPSKPVWPWVVGGVGVAAVVAGAVAIGIVASRPASAPSLGTIPVPPR